MPNTVYGPYTPTAWTGTTGINTTRLNNLETQVSDALHGFNGDLLTPFVLSGCVATRNGVNLKQLDVTAGSVYIKMSDNTIGLIATIASVTNQFLTSTPSTTYFLDINPDGSWSFATSHSAVTNHLTIASCTTDASGNILVVTDARPLTTSMLNGSSAPVAFPNSLSAPILYWGAGVSSNLANLQWSSANHENEYWTPQSGATHQGHLFIGWNGAGAIFPFSVGNAGVAALTNIAENGSVSKLASQATAGSFGVPVIVAQALNVHVTATTIQTIINYTVPVTGLYRVTGGFEMGNTSNALINFGVGWVGGGAGLPNLNGYFNDGTNFFNGVSAITHGWAYAVQPLTFYAAAAGNTITVQYTDRSGAPNDWVTAQIERLA